MIYNNHIIANCLQSGVKEF